MELNRAWLLSTGTRRRAGAGGAAAAPASLGQCHCKHQAGKELSSWFLACNHTHTHTHLFCKAVYSTTPLGIKKNTHALLLEKAPHFPPHPLHTHLVSYTAIRSSFASDRIPFLDTLQPPRSSRITGTEGHNKGRAVLLPFPLRDLQITRTGGAGSTASGSRGWGTQLSHPQLCSLTLHAAESTTFSLFLATRRQK